MTYFILCNLIQVVLRLFYRKRYVHGLDNIPAGRVLIAMNHPAGFLEPITLAGRYGRPLHFLVRGDVFKSRWLRPILVATNQHPIYRFRDGYEDMKRNQQQLVRIRQLVDAHKPILVYVEGSTEPVKQLRPLQKGLARMAMDCLDADNDQPLWVLPVGINFSDSTRPQSDVMMNVGTPIDAREYYAAYLENNNKGFKTLTTAVRKNLLTEIIHLDDTSDTELLNQCIDFSTIAFPAYSLIDSSDKLPFARQKALADHINSLTTDEKASLSKVANDLSKSLSDAGLSRNAVQAPAMAWWHYLLLVIGAPLALTGLVIHSLPLLGAYLFVEKKIKQPVFYAAIMSVALLALLVVLYITATIIGLVLLGLTTLVILGAMIAAGLWTHYYSYVVRRWLLHRQSGRVSTMTRTLHSDLTSTLPTHKL